MAAIELAPGAGQNRLAVQMATLMSERLETHPERTGAFERLGGRVAMVAEDTGASLTMRFDDHRVVVFDGIVGIPDLTLRGPADLIAGLSRIELGRFGLPDPRGRGTRAFALAIRDGRLQIHGLPAGLGLLKRLGTVLAVD